MPSCSSLHLEPGPDLRTLTTTKGSLEIWQPAPGVVFQRCKGHATVGFSETITQRLDVLLSKGIRPVVFDDWEGLTSYDSGARIHLTAWTAENASKLRGIHMLFRSKLVAMGVTVANLTLKGGMATYASRPEFESVLAAALARARSGNHPEPHGP